MKFLPHLFCFLLFTGAVAAQTWQPVPQEELQLAAPKVERDADAEVLFWEVRIADQYTRSGWQSTVTNHLRIKIFTERGRELNSKLDVIYGNDLDTDSKVEIKEIAARTIKPDGSVIDVKPGDVFDRDIAKANGVKVKAKSFAVPGIDVGAIVEYRWKSVRNSVFNFTRIELARDLPIHFVKYYIKPAQNVDVGMRLHSFNTESGFQKEDGGFYSTTMRNVPAFKEEPRMPSEFDVKPWVLMYYAGESERQAAGSYWRDIASAFAEITKDDLKVTSEIKAAAQKAIGDASDQLEKIRRIHSFCRASVKNVYDDSAGLTFDQLMAIKENKNPTEALKRGTGSWRDIDMLFAAMLVSVGMDARFAGAASRDDATFNRNFTNAYFLRHRLIAVKVGTEWRFFSPSDRHLPFGMLNWALQGQSVLIADSDATIWEMVPFSGADRSEQKRTAKLKLTADGTLDGEIRYEMNGHVGNFYREFHDDDTVAEREKSVIANIRRAIGDAAEVTGVTIENLDDSEKPLIYTFRIHVPGYTERTGKRIFLRPFVFARNAQPVFTSSNRNYDVSFNYAWKETDEVEIELPPGFSVESAETTKPVTNEKLGGTLSADLKISDDKTRLVYRRNFSYGRLESISLNKVFYSAVKGFFDSVKISDSQNVVLKEDSLKTN